MQLAGVSKNKGQRCANYLFVCWQEQSFYFPLFKNYWMFSASNHNVPFWPEVNCSLDPLRHVHHTVGIYGCIWKPPHESFNVFLSLALSITSTLSYLGFNTATESLSLHIQQSSSRIAYSCWMGFFEGTVCDASQQCCTGTWGRGLWAFPCSPHRPQLHVHCQGGQLCLSPFVCLPVATSWQLTCAHDQLWGCSSPWPQLIDALLGEQDADSLSKPTLQPRLCVPKLSDWFLLRNSCSPPPLPLCRSFCGSQGFAPCLPVSNDCQSRDEIIMHVPRGCSLTETMTCHFGFSATLVKGGSVSLL